MATAGAWWRRPALAHEYLLKPVSTKALHDRIIAIIGRPRPTVTLEGYYGPLPRRLVVANGSKGGDPRDDAAAVN